jgi:hypothetical protein
MDDARSMPWTKFGQCDMCVCALDTLTLAVSTVAETTNAATHRPLTEVVKILSPPFTLSEITSHAPYTHIYDRFPFVQRHRILFRSRDLHANPRRVLVTSVPF